MNKQVDFEYDIGDRVNIIDLKIDGYVCSLWYGDRGPQYEVAYWVDGERKKEYLFSDEIKLVIINKAEVAGFNKRNSILRS